MEILERVYAAQPREGTETEGLVHVLRQVPPRFMQLNPARGRKLTIDCSYGDLVNILVYAAQPREGTETVNLANSRAIIYVVYAAQPREGTETGDTMC